MFNFNVPLDWREATIPKKSGGVRHIRIPNDELKTLQKNILAYLYDLYYSKDINISSNAHGFVPYKNTCSSLIKHDITSKVFICMDVEDFFDSFPVSAVRKQLELSGIGPFMVDKILEVCTFNNSFPQGGPTSPYLTNIGMLETDLMLDSFAKANKFVYTRYADDITLSLAPNTEEPSKDPKHYFKVFHQVNTLLKESLGLKLKWKKNHVIIRGTRSKPQILGIVLRQDNKGYNASRKLRENTRSAVHKLAMKIQNQGGIVRPEDYSKWAEAVGAIQYLDYVRSFSHTDDATTADPRIQEKYFNYLESKFRKIK